MADVRDIALLGLLLSGGVAIGALEGLWLHADRGTKLRRVVIRILRGAVAVGLVCAVIAVLATALAP